MRTYTVQCCNKQIELVLEDSIINIQDKIAEIRLAENSNRVIDYYIDDENVGKRYFYANLDRDLAELEYFV